MKVRVKYAASFYAVIEVPDDAGVQQLGRELANIDIPEDDLNTYAEDSFEPVMDDNGDPQLYDQDNEPITFAKVKENEKAQREKDQNRCAN